jgi:hypothetical protein
VTLRIERPLSIIILLQVLLAGLILVRLLPLGIPPLLFRLIAFLIFGDCFFVCLLLVLHVRRRQNEPQVKYLHRLLALCTASVCGFFFLGHVISLLWAYNYTHRRFAPALVEPHEFANTTLLGLGFLASVILYREAVRGKSMSKHFHSVSD